MKRIFVLFLVLLIIFCQACQIESTSVEIIYKEVEYELIDIYVNYVSIKNNFGAIKEYWTDIVFEFYNGRNEIETSRYFIDDNFFSEHPINITDKNTVVFTLEVFKYSDGSEFVKGVEDYYFNLTQDKYNTFLLSKSIL